MRLLANIALIFTSATFVTRRPCWFVLSHEYRFGVIVIIIIAISYVG
jgi:hypothetical protein